MQEKVTVARRDAADHRALLAGRAERYVLRRAEPLFGRKTVQHQLEAAVERGALLGGRGRGDLANFVDEKIGNDAGRHGGRLGRRLFAVEATRLCPARVGPRLRWFPTKLCMLRPTSSRKRQAAPSSRSTRPPARPARPAPPARPTAGLASTSSVRALALNVRHPIPPNVPRPADRPRRSPAARRPSPGRARRTSPRCRCRPRTRRRRAGSR
jgi:hypothetical protein